MFPILKLYCTVRTVMFPILKLYCKVRTVMFPILKLYCTVRTVMVYGFLWSSYRVNFSLPSSSKVFLILRLYYKVIARIVRVYFKWST